MSSKRDRSNSNQPILEQLWYTWSAIGLGPLSAGFRIRAASRGLSDVTSPYVQSLDRYLRYILPNGTDPFAITPDAAPICLSYIETESRERILVYKTYSGKDGMGRPGSFFIHLLSNFPPGFSARQAIALWRSSVLRSSDVDPHTGIQFSGVLLDSLPFEDLLPWLSRESDILQTSGVSSSWLQDCFPLVIRAYLMWRRRWEHWKQQMSLMPPRQVTPQSEPPRLYIAAPSDMVATFIRGLTRCLPQQFIQDLTFSTYEYDVRSKGQVLLVGTAWPPSSSLDRKTYANQDLPAACYQEGVGLNCYNYDEHKTQLEDDPYAVSFANYATRCLAANNFEELDWLFSEKTILTPHLDVSGFLQMYDSYIVKALNPTQKDVELYLDNADADMLSKIHVQDLLLTLALGNPYWLTNFLKLRLTSLLTHQGDNPKIAGMLSLLAKAASQKAAITIANGNEGAFNAVLSIMSWIADSQSEAWHNLLRNLTAQSNIQTFLTRSPQAHLRLLRILSHVIPPINTDDVHPLLTIREPDFETFYKSELRPEWKDAATMMLINAAFAQNTVPMLGQKYQRAVSTLLQHLAQTSWFEAADLFETLTNAGYLDKFNLLTILLNEPPGFGRESGLLNKAHLNNEEYEEFLKVFCPGYLVDPLREASILELLRGFLTKDAARKLPLLESWLQSVLLTSWLEALPYGPDNLEKVLRAVSLPPNERNQFIERYGKHYLECYSQQFPAYLPSKLIADYLKEYLDSFNNRKSLWLHSSPAQDLFLFLGHSSHSTLLQSFSKKDVLLIKQYQNFCRFLSHPSTSMRDIRIFGQYLQELQADRDLVLIERLAIAFASRIKSETELAGITYMMSTLMTKTGLLQMLYGMVECIRDDMVRPDPLARQSTKTFIYSYIRFALCFASVYDFTSGEGMQPSFEEQIFIQTLLRLLLHNAQSSTIALLNEEAKQSHLNYWRDWLFYTSGNYDAAFTSDLQRGSYERERLHSIRSDRHSKYTLDTFFADPSSARKNIEELSNILSSRNRNWHLLESLARTFYHCIESETELTALTLSLTLRKSLSKSELLQMLYNLAEILRDDMTNNGQERIAKLRLEPYIRFMLCFESACDLLSPDEYTLFVRSFLNLMLQSVDEDSLRDIEKRSMNWPDEVRQKWQTLGPPGLATKLHLKSSRDATYSLPSTAFDRTPDSFFTKTASQTTQDRRGLAGNRHKSQSWATRLKNWFFEN